MGKQLKQLTVSLDHHFEGAVAVEDIMCATTLYAMGEDVKNVRDAIFYRVTKLGEDCSSCPFEVKCLASKINE